MLNVYCDESYDRNGQGFVYSFVIVSDEKTRKYEQSLNDEFNGMKSKYGIDLNAELHSTDIMGGRGKYYGVAGGNRINFHKEVVEHISKLDYIDIINGYAYSVAIAGTLAEWCLNRINTFVKYSSSDKAIIIADDGDVKLKQQLSRMGKLNPIPSQYGSATYDTAIENIEKITYVDSKTSIFVQLADVIAFILYKVEHPREGGYIEAINPNYWNELREKLSIKFVKRAFRGDPLGIVSIYK